MQKHTSEPLKISFADFLKLNGHGLLNSSNELPHWYFFLNFISSLLQTKSFETRGSCIAQVVIQKLSEENKEKDSDDVNMMLVLTPYTTINEILINDCDSFDFTNQEKQFIELIFSATRKKNIDIYIKLNDEDELTFFAQIFQKTFTEPGPIKISGMKKFPNGIVALQVEVKGGYVDHEVVVALKPPLNHDLRKKMSRRQLAAKGRISREGDNWFLEVSSQDILKIISEDEFEFLDYNLETPELLLQVARTLRFNAIYQNVDQKKNLTVQKISQLSIAVSKSLPDPDIDGKSKLMYSQAMNEFMIGFLHDPEAFIDFLLNLPREFFPYINREMVKTNKQKICDLLQGKPKSYFSTPKKDHTDLTEVASLLVGDNSRALRGSAVYSKYRQLIQSIDNTTNLTEMLGQHDTHTTWYFDQYTDYYYFLLMFYPLNLPL